MLKVILDQPPLLSLSFVVYINLYINSMVDRLLSTRVFDFHTQLLATECFQILLCVQITHKLCFFTDALSLWNVGSFCLGKFWFSFFFNLFFSHKIQFRLRPRPQRGLHTIRVAFNWIIKIQQVQFWWSKFKSLSFLIIFQKFFFQILFFVYFSSFRRKLFDFFCHKVFDFSSLFNTEENLSFRILVS